MDSDSRWQEELFFQAFQFWKHPVFLPDNRSEPCETLSRHAVSTNTLRLAGDKHLVARLSCRATRLAVSLYLMPSLFVFSSSQATPSVLLPRVVLTFCSASRKAHIIYILHITLENKGPECLKIPPVWLLVVLLSPPLHDFISLHYTVNYIAAL